MMLDIGTNDLCLTTCDPVKLASAIIGLVDSLITDFNVKHVCCLGASRLPTPLSIIHIVDA